MTSRVSQDIDLRQGFVRSLEERREPGAAEVYERLQEMLGRAESWNGAIRLERLKQAVYRVQVGDASGRALVLKRHPPAIGLGTQPPRMHTTARPHHPHCPDPARRNRRKIDIRARRSIRRPWKRQHIQALRRRGILRRRARDRVCGVPARAGLAGKLLVGDHQTDDDQNRRAGAHRKLGRARQSLPRHPRRHVRRQSNAARPAPRDDNRWPREHVVEALYVCQDVECV